jgi:hypothetical protein
MTEHFSRSTVSSEDRHDLFEAFRPRREMSELAKRAVAAGVPVKLRKGVEYVYVNDATYEYLASQRIEIEVPPMCCCAQRPYPHDLAAHRKLFESPGSYDAFDERIRFAPEGMRWPWSLRFAQETEA